MPITVKHATQAIGPEAGNGEIGKTAWNEDHTLLMDADKILGRSTAGTGEVEEIAVGAGLTLSGGTLTASGAVGGSNTQIQYNSSGTFAGASGLTTNGTELTIASGTKTADAPVLNMSQTWNNAAVTFTGLKYNATDTASADASLLMDLQVGGSSAFNVSKGGSLKLGRNASGTNVAASNVVIAGSQGTGTGAGGSIIFQVAPAGSSGTAQNAFVDALTINSAREAAFTTAADTGIILNYTGAGLIQFRSSGVSRAYIFGQTNGILELQSANNQILALGSSGTAGIRLRIGGFYSFLFNDADNTLALRNGASAQTFNVYNTFTDTSNYVRSEVTAFSVYQRAAGTGLGNEGSFEIGNMTGTTNLFFRVNGGTRVWYFGGSTGHFLANVDNTYDIGASGATRPRSIYVGTNGVFGGTVTAGLYFQTAAAALNGNGGVYFGSASANRAELQATGVGILTIGRWGTGDVTLGFGGTISSFPALKRSSTTLQARLADDSGFASVQGKITTETAYAAGDPTTTGYLVVYDSTGTAYKIPAVAV